MTEFLVEYQSTIGVLTAGFVVASLLYIGLHTDLVNDVSDRNRRKKES